MSYDFADRLIEMRRSRGLSQEELAKDLGLSRQAVSKWERAESAPDIGNLVALANIYDVTLDELVRGTESEATEEVVAEATEVEVEVAEGPAVAPTTAYEQAYGAAAEATAPTEEGASVPPTTSSAAAAVPPPPPEGAVPVQPAMTTPPPPVTAEPPKPKNPLYTFPYPLLVALVYLVIGFCFGWWHPGWVLFFTIPFYYWIASVIAHDPEYAARHGVRTE